MILSSAGDMIRRSAMLQGLNSTKNFKNAVSIYCVLTLFLYTPLDINSIVFKIVLVMIRIFNSLLPFISF